MNTQNLQPESTNFFLFALMVSIMKSINFPINTKYYWRKVQWMGEGTIERETGAGCMMEEG